MGGQEFRRKKIKFTIVEEEKKGTIKKKKDNRESRRRNKKNKFVINFLQFVMYIAYYCDTPVKYYPKYFPN